MLQLSRTETKKLIALTKMRNMALTMFRPLPHQEPFIELFAREVLLKGGNRAGKSLLAACKTGAISMDMPIILNDGRKINMRRPHQIGRPLVIWIIGYDWKHIGQTIYRLLFRPGLFQVIKDKDTGSYRAFRQWDAEDVARESEAKPSPPLIPPRYVDQKSWDWENRKGRQFKSVRIIDPTTQETTAEIYCYASTAEAKAGDPVDVIWIDEAIQCPEHYGEWQARLIDRSGFLYWSSWPKTDNIALQTLHERSKACEGQENPPVRTITITLSDNKALSEEKRREAIGMWTTEEERLARDKGEFVTGQYRMYPLFDPFLHQAIYEVGGDALSEILKRNDGVPPKEWTHELILDPGTQSPGVLFIAIPPPHYGNYCVVYDEITTRADADQLADKIKMKVNGLLFHRFIIDARAAASHGMGYTKTVAENYTRAFNARNISCYLTKSGFSLGCTDVGGRIMSLQEWLHVQKSGYPKLRIVRDRCPKLCDQMQKYMKARVNNEIRDDRPASGQTLDLAVCLEYASASYPEFVPHSRIASAFEQNHKEGWYHALFASRRPRKKDSTCVLGPQY